MYDFFTLAAATGSAFRTLAIGFFLEGFASALIDGIDVSVCVDLTVSVCIASVDSVWSGSFLAVSVCLAGLAVCVSGAITVCENLSFCFLAFVSGVIRRRKVKYRVMTNRIATNGSRDCSMESTMSTISGL